MGETQIEELFSKFCEVRRVVMKDVVDRGCTEVKGHYAFVWTGGVEQAIAAKNALHNVKINGKKLQVTQAASLAIPGGSSSFVYVTSR